MSILSRAAETYLPLAVACEQVGYPPDRSGQRNLRQQLRRKGFASAVRRVGNNFSIQVATWQAYLKRCEQDSARHRATIGAQARARWAERRAGNGLASH
jgi:hypothetical protein